MAYSLMLKRTRNNGMRPKATNRTGESTEGRVDSKMKIPAQQYYDKYLAMARESMAIGDRIAAEGFYQHAEHYLRLMNEFKPMSIEVGTADKEELTQDESYPFDEDALLANQAAVIPSQFEPESEDL